MKFFESFFHFEALTTAGIVRVKMADVESIAMSDLLYDSQDRVNANIRKTFNLLLSLQGLQRVPMTEESRFVGLEFAYQFTEHLEVGATSLSCMRVVFVFSLTTSLFYFNHRELGKH